jgi:hypothetical protein
LGDRTAGELSGTAKRENTKTKKGEERVMGWMFDNVGRLIAWLQKPANHCEPFTPNDSRHPSTR